MAKASTPVNVQSAPGTGTQVTVTWALPELPVAGNGTFAIQFVNRSNSKDIVTPFGGPYTTTPPTDNNPYSQSVDVGDAILAGKIPSDYQAEVMALGATTPDNSPWGMQTYWVFGFSLTVEIGSESFTLRQQPGSMVYVLPVNPNNPPTVTYVDLQTFAQPFLGNGFSFPQNWPNGQPINSSLQLNRFAIDTGNKLLDLDFQVNLNWTLFTDFTINTVGLALQRTNGTAIQG